MATAGDVARRALTQILVESPDSPLDASEYADALDALNNYMAEREYSGIRLGYTPVTNVADEVTVPAGALRGIIANLAIEVAPDYGGVVSASLVKQADEGLKTMRRIARPNVGRVSYPPTLPMGGGNAHTFYNRNHYYGKQATALITMVANATATTIATAGTYVKARGFWEVEDYETLRPDITGRITNTHDGQVVVKAHATLSVKAAASITSNIALYINGGGVALSTSASLSTTPAAVTITGNVTLQPGEYLELWVTDASTTQDITVVDGRIELNRSAALT